MKKYSIQSIRGRQVYTTRNILGVEAVVETEGGIIGRAVCNAGVSVGTHEIGFAYDKDSPWGKTAVEGASRCLETVVLDAVRGMDVTDQHSVDRALIQLNRSGKVGGNAIAAVSAAVLKAGASALGLPLYRHIGGVEALRLPVPGIPAAHGSDRWGGGVTTPGGKPSISFTCYDFSSFHEASLAGWQVYGKWREEMLRRGQILTIYDYFNVGPGVFDSSDRELFALMTDCINRAGYEGRIGIQIDCAADTYYDRENRVYRGLFQREPMTRDQLLAFYQEIIRDYPVVVVEDPFNENDYESHALLTKAVDIQTVGDDLFTTMKERVEMGWQRGACNTVLLKVNQVGTISQALQTVRFAYDHGYGVMPCESRGESEAIADYCVGIDAGSVRECGIGHYAANRFLAIEDELGEEAQFWGRMGLRGRRFRDRSGAGV